MNVIVTGIPGSGKTSMVNLFVEKGYHKFMDITDRPRRKGEVAIRSDHIHVSKNDFDKLWESGRLIGVRSFRVDGEDFRYGIDGKSWDELFYDADMMSVISIGPPIVLDLLKSGNINKDTTVILDMDTDASSCAKRMQSRGDSIHEIKRRLHDDQMALIDVYSFINYGGQWDSQPVIESFSHVAIEKACKDPMEEVIKYLIELKS